jgi:hypothetical protein
MTDENQTTTPDDSVNPTVTESAASAASDTPSNAIADDTAIVESSSSVAVASDAPTDSAESASSAAAEEPTPTPDATLEDSSETVVDPTPTQPETADEVSPAIPPFILEQPPEPPTVFASEADEFNFLSAELSSLHLHVSHFAAVSSISGQGDDMQSYTIDFEPQATEQERRAALIELLRWPQTREQLKISGYNFNKLQQWFNEQIAAGYKTSAGFTLGLSTNDVALLTGNYVLAQAAAGLGMPFPPIIDVYGQPHYMPNLETLTAIMLEYGQYRAGLAAIFAERQAQLNAALQQLFAPA